MSTESAGTLADVRSRAIPALGMSWPLLVAVVAYLGSLTSRLLADPDTYWHLAAANWMFENLSIPTADPFSHTMRGAPWVAHEWLSEVFLGVSYHLAGWAGPVVLAAAAYAVALSLVCRHLLRHLEPIYALVFVTVAALLGSAHLQARPHALVFPLIAAWGIALVRARENGRAPAWPWALLMAAWANLHGSFPLGIGLVAFFAAEALWEAAPQARRQVAWEWGKFMVLATGAALLTPHGVHGFAFATDVSGMDFTLAYINEWRSPDFHKLQPLEVAIMLGGLAVFLRGLRLPLLRAVLVLGLLHLALLHGRHGDIFGLLVPVAVAEPIGRQWLRHPNSGSAASFDQWFHRLATPARAPALVAMGLLLLATTWLAVRDGALRPPSSITPDAALEAVRTAAPKGQVMNSYNFGGYLIFSGIAPSIDGRADMYGDAFVADYARAVGLEMPDNVLKFLERHDIGWTLFTPGTPAIALLDRLPGWRRLHADKTAVVHVRLSRN